MHMSLVPDYRYTVWPPQVYWFLTKHDMHVLAASNEGKSILGTSLDIMQYPLLLN